MSAEKILQIARNEVGYLEKKSSAYLNDKTANAGNANYTKYGAWFQNGVYQAQPWCDMFVSWCAEQAGEAAAVGCFAYVPSHTQFFRNKGLYFARGEQTPQQGDIIIFRDESHIGLVEYVSGGYVHTIEGNTSGGSTLVSNGGGVHQKCYALTSGYIQGYGRPAYSNSNAVPVTETTTIKEEFEVAKTYKNGSTSEPVYADTAKTVKIGSLNPWETCDCLGTIGGMYIVRYPVDGTNSYKVGLVHYAGGISA